MKNNEIKSIEEIEKELTEEFEEKLKSGEIMYVNDNEIQETVNEDSIEVLVEEGSVENVVSDENNMS